MTDLEKQRVDIYEWLTREFKTIAGRLDPEGDIELDGKLWALSAHLQEMGMWKALQIVLENRGQNGQKAR